MRERETSLVSFFMIDNPWRKSMSLQFSLSRARRHCFQL